MKKHLLLFMGILFLGLTAVYAQTGEVTLEVKWVPSGSLVDNDLAKYRLMDVNIDNGNRPSLLVPWGKSIVTTLPSGTHTLRVGMLRYDTDNKAPPFKTSSITFTANSGRVVVNATPRYAVFGDNTITLTSVSQPQPVMQQPQTNNNQPSANSGNTQNNQQKTTPAQNNAPKSNAEQLTYYVDGKAKTVTAVYVGSRCFRFYLDNGGNIACHYAFQPVGGSWGRWEDGGIVENRIRGIDDTPTLFGYLSGSEDYYSAAEINKGGVRTIWIYQKNSDGYFLSYDRDYVYVTAKEYEVQR